MCQGPGFWAPSPMVWSDSPAPPQELASRLAPIPQGIGRIPSSLSICGAACSSYGAAKAAVKQPGAPTTKSANKQSDLQIPYFAFVVRLLNFNVHLMVG